MSLVFVSRLAGDIRIIPHAFKCAPLLTNFQQDQWNGRRGKSAHTSVTRYYDVLGLSPKATQKQIKSAYYNMSKLYHPDVAKGDKNHALFTEINEAYEVLGNLRKRRMYDRGIYTSDTSFTSAAGSHEEDYTAAYRAKQSPFERGDRPPPPRGRTNVYNFDEFYRQHYNEVRERRANEYKEYILHKENMLRRKQMGQHTFHQGHVQSLFLAVSVLIGVVTFAISRENYDKDLIGNRIGSNHYNYYGAYDSLRKVPSLSTDDNKKVMVGSD